MKSINSFLKSIAVILTFLLSFYGKKYFDSYFEIVISRDIWRLVAFYSWWIVPPILLMGLLFGFRKIISVTGLQSNLPKAFIFSLISVAPMLVGSAFIADLRENLTFFGLLKSSLFPGFFEEFLFRGFLFGLLFCRFGWGFIPAGILGAMFFGVGHIYQGSNIAETIGIFLVTAMGAGWFAWLYIEWDKNLWVPILLHTLMNLSWSLFDVSNNALGGLYPNIFRAATIAITIIITIKYHKHRGLIIRKHNLIFNR